MKIRTFFSAIMISALFYPTIGQAGQSLGIPKVDVYGQPIDVGLIVLGHSTSQYGDWPAKLVTSLNQRTTDRRNYQVFKAITGGDGGFLWTQSRFQSQDTQYNRVQASAQKLTQASGTENQWCQDNTGVRWSCRRTKLDRVLGIDQLPAECRSSTTPSEPYRCAVESASTTMLCKWHENGGAVQRASLTIQQCWAKMDVRIALVQDTTNRSWPMDDYTADGVVNANDFFKPLKIKSTAALPCKGTSGVLPLNVSPALQSVDWNCDGALSAADSVSLVYAGWLKKLADDLVDINQHGNTPLYGNMTVDHVFFTQKPVEMFTATGQACSATFPGETCSLHDMRDRSRNNARPFDRFYQPSVYWEYRALETLAAMPTLNTTRIHLVTDTDVRRMWNRSAECYSAGITSGWSIPLSVGRPSIIKADITEDDSITVLPPTTDPTYAAKSAVFPDNVGCMLSDHIHHNSRDSRDLTAPAGGGWMMADVWYGGLLSYLQ